MGELKRLDAAAVTVVDSSPASILASIRAALSNALGYDVDNADPWMVVAASLLPYFVQGRALADAAAKATNLAFASGETLDALAAGHGLTRNDARAAVVHSYVSIGFGTEITAGNTGRLDITSLAFVKQDDAGNVIARFEYSGAVFFEVGDTWKRITLTCTQLGPEYNGLTDFVMTDFVWEFVRDDAAMAYEYPSVAVDLDPNNYAEKITSVGGAFTETDDEFAKRAYNEIMASNTAGSAAYYRAVAMRVPGIIDARVISVAEAKQAALEIFGSDSGFDGYDVVVMPLAEEAARGWTPFISDIPVQVSINTAMTYSLQAALDAAKIVGSNVMVFPSLGILQMFSNVYTLKYWLYKSDVHEHGLEEMQTRISAAFDGYRHWQCDSLQVPFSIGEAIKALITAGAAKVELYDINGVAAIDNDALYAEMYTLLYAARRFGRYDSQTGGNVILDSLRIEYAGQLEKVKGYL